jgi:hypothetical protein
MRTILDSADRARPWTLELLLGLENRVGRIVDNTQFSQYGAATSVDAAPTH